MCGTCVCTGTHTHVCASQEESGQAVRYLPLQLVTLLAKNGVPLNTTSPFWPARQLFGTNLSLPSQCLNYRCMHPYWAFHLGAEASNSGPHVCTASALYPRRQSMKSYFYIKPSTSKSWACANWVTRLDLFNWCASRWCIDLNLCCIRIP